jgi:glycosyltransferase involved in cell wall biosynthesis
VHGSGIVADVLAGVAAQRAHVVAVCHIRVTGDRDPLKDVADRQLVLRPELIEHLAGLGYPSDRLELVEPSVASHFFDVRRDADRSGPPRVGFIGRLSHWKGADAIVPAMQRLADLGVRGELVLLGVGDVHGDEVTAIRAGVSETGWNVRHFGRIPNAEVADHLATWDALFFPSRAEGTPRTVLEALAVGVPVVAVDDVLPTQLLSCPGVHVRSRDDLAAGLAEVLRLPRPARAPLQARVLTHDDAALTLDRIVEEVRYEVTSTSHRFAVRQRLQRLRRDRRLRARLAPLRKADPRALYRRALRATRRPS